MNLLNFTQHDLQQRQIDEGFQELPTKYRLAVKALLDIDVSDREELENSIQSSKYEIAAIAQRLEAHTVLIGGHPGLMIALAKELKRRGIQPVMAHSDRISIDLPNGRKVSEFHHKFFYPV